MLGQRIITAAVLLAVLALTLALANPWWFVALLALGAACAAWEWLRLTVRQPPSGALCVGLAAALLAAMLAMAQAPGSRAACPRPAEGSGSATGSPPGGRGRLAAGRG
ncbi:phosphatidate cytidylyltransferase, partial [Bordetella bronchiseptica]|uniref:phosphatidate cytidylyltransferase n=1 Tax=Bordetella bronchiseptica TaxID=518 RepID=UPI001FB13CFC